MDKKAVIGTFSVASWKCRLAAKTMTRLSGPSITPVKCFPETLKEDEWIQLTKPLTTTTATHRPQHRNKCFLNDYETD